MKTFQDDGRMVMRLQSYTDWEGHRTHRDHVMLETSDDNKSPEAGALPLNSQVQGAAIFKPTKNLNAKVAALLKEYPDASWKINFWPKNLVLCPGYQSAQ